jgi:prepilin-type N-terminal cleavage/methylation domain-containing protein
MGLGEQPRAGSGGANEGSSNQPQAEARRVFALASRTKSPAPAGFTLIELLVVTGILSFLAAISLPVLGSIRRATHITADIVNTRHTVLAEICFANDHGGRFAEPLSTIFSPVRGFESYEPSTVVNVDFEPREHRNQSEYLGEYLNNWKFLHCPESPGRFDEAREAFKAGDDWRPGHWLMGTKCLWRWFKGISTDGLLVEGPKTMYRSGEGEVLVSCLLNYRRYGCDRLMSGTYLDGADTDRPSIKTNFIWPKFWVSNLRGQDLEVVMQGVSLRAGYVDGHVVSAKASETMGVWVSSEPFDPDTGPSLRGLYFLPTGGLR